MKRTLIPSTGRTTWSLKQKKFGNNNHSALDNTVKSTNMRKSIDTYVQGIAHDDAEFIVNGSESIADYIIKTAENGTGYEEFFDDDELDETGEPTDEQIDELKAYLNQNYNYLPNFRDGKRRIVLCDIIDFDEFQSEFNRQKAEKELPMLLNDAECVFEDGNCLMWIDDDNNVVNAAKNFLQSNRVKFIVRNS